MRATSSRPTYSTRPSFQDITKTREKIRENHVKQGHTYINITRPKRPGKPWIVTYQDHQKGTVRLVGNFNEQGIFTDGTLRYNTSEGLTILKGTFERNSNTYDIVNGNVKEIYTQPNNNATDVTPYNDRYYPYSQYSVGEA